MSETPIPLCSCNCCGRNFHPDVIDRHSIICQKNHANSLKRKTFDSFIMRAKDTEMEKIQNQKKFLPTHMREKTKLPLKKPNWRAKHEDFIKTIRAARGEYPTPTQPQKHIQSYVNPDYVQCEFCSRRFNEGAAERHIPFCKEQHNRLRQKSNTEMNALDKMTKRIQYKAPLPKSGQKRVIGSNSKTVKTRSLHEEIESSPTSIPTTNASNRRFIRGDRSKGDPRQELFSTRDITKEKQQSYIKKNTVDEHVGNAKVERRDREINKRRNDARNVREMSQMVSEMSLSNSESSRSVQSHERPKGYPSQLPSLRSKSHSASSVASTGSNGCSHRDVPLNEYGTPMAKFCYECGGCYPVPQAKFCCFCGTKRI